MHPEKRALKLDAGPGSVLGMLGIGLLFVSVSKREL
jgi:hypothetical protein